MEASGQNQGKYTVYTIIRKDLFDGWHSNWSWKLNRNFLYLKGWNHQQTRKEKKKKILIKALAGF